MDTVSEYESRRIAYTEILDDYEAFFGFSFHGANHRDCLRQIRFWIAEGRALLDDEVAAARGRVYYYKLRMVLDYINVYMILLIHPYNEPRAAGPWFNNKEGVRGESHQIGYANLVA